MTQQLRGALRDLADIACVDLTRMAETAVRGAGRRQARRRTAVPVLAAITVVVLALGALFAVEGGDASHPRPATPLPGPGSLPDRIFPTPERLYSIESKPVLGAALVYTTIHGLVAISADGDEARDVTLRMGSMRSFLFALSPDGTKLAVVDDHEWINAPQSISSAVDRIQLLDLSTGLYRPIALPSELPFVSVEGGLSWSPSGTHLAFKLAERASPEGPSGSTLAILDITTRRLDRIADIATGSSDSAAPPAWSPDGARLAVSEEWGDLRVFDLDGKVAFHRTGLWSLKLRGNAWSPDGRTLAVVQGIPEFLVFLDAGTGEVAANYAFDQSDDFSVDREVLGWRGGTPVVVRDRHSLVTYAWDGKQQLLVTDDDPFQTKQISLARDVLANGQIRVAVQPSGRPAPLNNWPRVNWRHINWGSDTMKWIYSVTGAALVIFLLEFYDRRRRPQR
jgi:Tol biopolymer transport system component